MGKINVLSFSVANLIAAGEVVDRPASVIKELMENSIDAGATRIAVEIQNGGVVFMRVTDNGCGMEKDDLPIAVRRHATSKIKNAEDLDEIVTLGFRGEALAATCAVSNVRMISKMQDAPMGAMLEVRGGNIVSLSERGASDGTTVIVEDLFFNVPARRKFLKKDVTEAMAVTANVEKIALSHPEIAISLISDGNLKLETAGDGSLMSAIWAVFGKEFASRLISIDSEYEGIRIHGFIGRSDNVKANRNGENFFINGRYVRSKTATAALEQAFVSYLPQEKFPVCVLFLEMNPKRVDVNVHPAKLEVKFSNEKPVFEAIYYAVRTALEQNVSRPEVRLNGITGVPGGRVSDAIAPIRNDRSAPQDRQSRNGSQQLRMPQSSVRQPILTGTSSSFEHISAQEYRSQYAGLRTAGQGTPRPSFRQPETSGKAVSAPVRSVNQEAGEGTASPGNVLRIPEHLTAEQYLELRDAVAGGAVVEEDPPDERTAAECTGGPVYPTGSPDVSPNTLPSQSAGSDPETDQPCEIAEQTPAEEQPYAAPDGYRILGEAFHSYVLVEVGEKLLVIDKHAAHERMIFERLKRNLKQREVPSQVLMLPLEVMLMTDEVGALETYRQELEAVGFGFRTARNTVFIDALPDGIEPSAGPDMLAEIAGRLQSATGSAQLTRDIVFEKALYQASCKAAIKAGREYPEEHIEWLVAEMMKLPDITFCPHGRPVAMEISKRNLDHQFERC